MFFNTEYENQYHVYQQQQAQHQYPHQHQQQQFVIDDTIYFHQLDVNKKNLENTSCFPGYHMRIVCLPKGFTTVESVKFLVEDVLMIGRVDIVNIQEKNIQPGNPQTYKTAYIVFLYWYWTVNTSELFERFNLIKDDTTIKLFSENKFCWDTNGTKMGHISIQKKTLLEASRPFVPKVPYVPNPCLFQMIIPKREWKGLYIPLIEEGLEHNGKLFRADAENIQDFIEKQLYIGKVRRVDVVDRDDLLKHPNEVAVKAAFIHMDYWYRNPFTEKLRRFLNTHNYGYRVGENMFTKMNRDAEMEKRYLVLKINHKPIEEVNPDDLSSTTMEELQSNNKILKTKYKELALDFITEFENIKDMINPFQHMDFISTACSKIEEIKKRNQQDIYIETKKSNLVLNIYQLYAINKKLSEEIAKVEELKEKACDILANCFTE